MRDEHHEENCPLCNKIKYLIKERVELEVNTRAADDPYYIEDKFNKLLDKLIRIDELEGLKDRVEELENQVRALQGYDPMDE